VASVQRRRSGSLVRLCHCTALCEAAPLSNSASPPPWPSSQTRQTSCCKPLHLQNWSLSSAPATAPRLQDEPIVDTVGAPPQNCPVHSLTFTLPGSKGPLLFSSTGRASTNRHNFHVIHLLFSSSVKSDAQTILSPSCMPPTSTPSACISKSSVSSFFSSFSLLLFQVDALAL